MRSPEGQEFPQCGLLSRDRAQREDSCGPQRSGPGYRPAIRAAGTGTCDELYFTAIITLEAQGHRTKYTAIAIHGDEATSKKHEEMGFYQGWGTALDQLVALGGRLAGTEWRADARQNGQFFASKSL